MPLIPEQQPLHYDLIFGELSVTSVGRCRYAFGMSIGGGMASSMARGNRRGLYCVVLCSCLGCVGGFSRGNCSVVAVRVVCLSL